MQAYYQNKNIVITGATSGIGKDLAIKLAKLGANLFLLGRREHLLEEVKKNCLNEGATKVEIYRADVTDKKVMLEARDVFFQQFRNIDIVIANAGIGGLNPAHNFSLEDNESMMAINYFGMANTLMPFVSSMISQGYGVLVGVSSLASIRGLPFGTSYSGSKAAQRIFLESLRVDLKSYNIKVITVMPGFVSTPMTDHENFYKPFMIPVEKSTQNILKAIKKGKALCSYPFPMVLLSILNYLLPVFLYDFIARLVAPKNITEPTLFLPKDPKKKS